MELDEQDFKVKLEIKEEYENIKDEDCKEICHSLVGYIKEEEAKFQLSHSNNSLLNIQKIGSQDEYLLGIDSKMEVDIKEHKELVQCKIENDYQLDDKKNVNIDNKESLFLMCLKEGIFKTVKRDHSKNEDKEKCTPVTSEETSQGNSSEKEESCSEIYLHNKECEDKNIPESSNNIPKTSSKTRKKYVKPRKYICQYCNKGFPQSDILKYHIMTHTGEKPYECNYCCIRFKMEISLKRHIQIHTAKKFSCNVCKKRFVTNYNLKIHKLIHENKKQFKCALCSSTFNARFLLYKHITRVHRKTLMNVEDFAGSNTAYLNTTEEASNKLQCDYCKKKYLSKDCLREHITKVHGRTMLNGEGFAGNNTACLNTTEKALEKFECDYCKKKYLSKHHLRVHIQIKHMSKKYYCCKICGIKSENRYCSDHESRNNISFTCSVCKSNFTDRRLFRQHMNNIHTTDKPYGCTLCNASFKMNSNLTAHIEVHHKTHSRKFLCEICNMSFNRETYLKRHIKIHTKSDRTFRCDICDIKCRSKTDIRRHVETHFGRQEKCPFQCEYCDKSFSKPSKLSRHQVVHTGEKPYKCNLCDKAYKDSCSLKYHQDQHQGNTYTCHKCGFLSANEHSFKRHIRQMICQKKTFSCEVCGKSLTTEKYYKKHMTRFHSEDE